MASYESYYEQIKKQTAADRQAAKDKSNQLYENQKTVAQEQFNSQIKDTTSAYDENYRMANVQRKVNERQIAENMANMGLTDSGLSRTQITANQLSYGNTVGKLNIAKQDAVDALALALRQSITGIENNRLQAEAGIDQQYDKYASDAATDMYKADVAAETARYKAAVSAANKAYSSNLSQIKSDIKQSLLTKKDFNALKKTKIRSRDGSNNQNFSYTYYNGKFYKDYAEYVADVMYAYANENNIDPSALDSYYNSLVR